MGGDWRNGLVSCKDDIALDSFSLYLEDYVTPYERGGTQRLNHPQLTASLDIMTVVHSRIKAF